MGIILKSLLPLFSVEFDRIQLFPYARYSLTKISAVICAKKRTFVFFNEALQITMWLKVLVVDSGPSLVEITALGFMESRPSLGLRSDLLFLIPHFLLGLWKFYHM